MIDIPAMVEQAVSSLRRRCHGEADVGIVLGTGRGEFSDCIESPVVIDFQEVPHLSRASALDHKGRFVWGQIAGLPVMIMDGRLHRYEGHPWWQITFPIRIMGAMGIRLLILSNASGGLNPAYSLGDLLIIEDHIDLMGSRPAAQAHRGHGGGDRPLPSNSIYDKGLIEQGLQIARGKNITAWRGVYAALPGPNYETRAEYRFLRQVGADAVGMSTVPEARVAAELGMRVFAVSVVTNVCRPDAPRPTDGAAVVAAAAKAEPRVREVVMGMLSASTKPPAARMMRD